MKEEYSQLKLKLGRIPDIEDFDRFESIDIMKIINKFGSYHAFLVRYDTDYKIRLSVAEEEIIKYVSMKLAKGKRVHELVMLKCIVNLEDDLMESFLKTMKDVYDIVPNELEIESTVKNLTNEFTKVSEQKYYYNCIFMKSRNGEYYVHEGFKDMLRNNDFKPMLSSVVKLGINRYNELYCQRYEGTNFVLNQKYTYEDVCRLLNWERNMNAQNIGGYIFDKRTKTLPVFINYVKEDGSIAYEDRFISPEKLIALSKHPRKLDSVDRWNIYNAKNEGTRIYLFVRKLKDDNEAKEFYFLGSMEAEGEPNPVILEETNSPAFEISYRMETPVREDIYDYITN